MQPPDEDVIVIPAGVREAMIAHARAEAPHECCGLLLGTSGRIALAVEARNVADPPQSRYRIDPVDHFAAIRRARGAALDVIGAYHSHPHSAAAPSPTDRTEAFGRLLYVIVGPIDAATPPEIGAYRLVDGNFVGIRLVPE